MVYLANYSIHVVATDLFACRRFQNIVHSILPEMQCAVAISYRYDKSASLSDGPQRVVV